MNKPIPAITNWKDFVIIDDVLIPHWSKYAKRGDISLREIEKKYGVPAEEYIEAVLLNERERILKDYLYGLQKLQGILSRHGKEQDGELDTITNMSVTMKQMIKEIQVELKEGGE